MGITETTRTIAEIIGWRTESHCDMRGTLLGYHRPDGSSTTEPPTVNDLLAWLREQGYDVSVAAQRTHLAGEHLLGDRPVRVNFKPFRPWLEGVQAPTLLEALERAVRAVADA
jgi:hypothetical protein